MTSTSSGESSGSACLASGLIDCYFGGRRRGEQLVKHQIDSFNDFLSSKIKGIIEGFNPIDIYNTFMPEHNCHRYVLSLSLHNPLISKPMILEKDGTTKVMLPNDARLRNLTYAAPLTVDLQVTAKVFVPEMGSYTCDSKKISSVNLGRIPLMVQSRYCMLGSARPEVAKAGHCDECLYDYGGYFVINGSEKVVISQDRIAENRTYVFVNNKASNYSHVAEIRSVQDTRFGVPKTLTLKLSNKATAYGRCIKLCMHHIKHDIPVFVMFRALGVESDSDIIRCILQNSLPSVADLLACELAGCIDDGSNIYNQQAALEYIAQHLALPHQHPSAMTETHRLSVLANVLRKDMLPHVGQDLTAKAIYIGDMVSRLLRCSMGLDPLDDRDSYVNKRLDTPGVLLANLFRQYYGKVIKDMRVLVQKDINNGPWRATNKFINVVNTTNVYKIIKPTILEAGLKYGLATGNWGAKTTSRVRQGVAQVLNRMTYIATLSHLRRVNTPIEKTGKLIQPRKLHPTQWGIICPAETPEGASVGLVKNLALLTHITIASPSDMIRESLVTLGTRMFSSEASTTQMLNCLSGLPAKTTRVMLNGAIIGVHSDPDVLFGRLKDLKKSGAINVFTSIIWSVHHAKVAICTEGGRFLRPVLVVEGGKRSLMQRLVLERPENKQLLERCLKGSADWHEIVLSGCIEYLDVEEVNMSMIAMSPDALHAELQYTHVDIAPIAMLGVVAGSIPFSDHNQAPRNTYQSAMGKQAIGVYATNFRHRFDTMVHVLSYPQKPLVSTHTARILNCDKLPCGVNAIVAIACFTGFNQEDSVIANESAVGKGLLNSTFYRTFREQNSKNHSTGEEEFFCVPDPATTRSIKPYNYAKLRPNGFVPADTFVDAGDVIVGKCMPHKSGQSVSNKDTSLALKSNERGFIDCNCNGDQFTNVTGDGYTFAKVRIRQDRVPTIGDKVSCYTAEHEVLTKLHGWVPIAKVDPAVHSVASLRSDGCLEYQVPSEVQKYVYQGKMVSVRGQGVDLLVTPEHRLVVMSDNHEYRVICAAQVANGTAAVAHRCIKIAINIDSKLSHSSSSDRSNQLLGGFISELIHVGNPESRLPGWVVSQDSMTSASIVRGIFNAGKVLLTRSQTIADQVQQMCLNGGFCCDLADAPIGDDGKRWISMILLFHYEHTSPPIKASFINSSEERMVYCCTVPHGPGIIYVRRFGMPVWCGNSRHGQKGTIGMLYREEDMPFSSNGIIPSLIINPHAIPSRMTIGQLMEALECKVGALAGAMGDASPFNGRTVESIASELQALGAERYGNEIMYNPRSGEQVECAIFLCPTYYQRLKHMVEDKVHSRAANGPVVLLTRQPAEGRARDGGLRLGEMELECLWAHGSMYFLKERFMECSDNYRIFVCRKCHMIATVNPERNIYLCKACKNILEFDEVRVPYASKLLMQEVQTMSIGTFITTQ